MKNALAIALGVPINIVSGVSSFLAGNNLTGGLQITLALMMAILATLTWLDSKRHSNKESK